MKKPFKHTDMSDILCSNPGCNKFLKKNFVVRKGITSNNAQKLVFCYGCYSTLVLQPRRDNVPHKDEDHPPDSDA